MPRKKFESWLGCSHDRNQFVPLKKSIESTTYLLFTTVSTFCTRIKSYRRNTTSWRIWYSVLLIAGFLTECTEHKEKWHEQDKCEVKWHPGFAYGMSNESSIPFLRRVAVGSRNGNNYSFRWVKVERKIARCWIATYISGVRYVKYSFQ